MKNIRRNIPTIFAILLLGTLVLCCACVSPGNVKPETTTTGVNVGLSQVPTQYVSPYISFNEAKKEFEAYIGTTVKLPVYYLYGRDVDSSGNASAWLFGVRQAAGFELLMLDRTGWKVIPWNATLPSEEIVLDQVVPTGTLFSNNKDALSNTTSTSMSTSRNLVLKQGVYTLTITSGNESRTLTFNATTGALITTHV